jgi:hypothetical protein
MSLFISRKVFIVVAGGNASAQRHFEDTIQRKRTLEEVRRFLPQPKRQLWEMIQANRQAPISVGQKPGVMLDSWPHRAAPDEPLAGYRQTSQLRNMRKAVPAGGLRYKRGGESGSS